MFGALGPNAFYIHAVFNLFAVVIVYCFYPEVSCRTLEEIDLLFASKTPFVWETEKKFQELKLQHGSLVRGAERYKPGSIMEGEVDEKAVSAHDETAKDERQ